MIWFVHFSLFLIIKQVVFGLANLFEYIPLEIKFGYFMVKKTLFVKIFKLLYLSKFSSDFEKLRTVLHQGREIVNSSNHLTSHKYY